MRVLAVVAARGGSRGIPRKNLRDVAGRPLIAHILGTLAQVPDLRVVISTEDGEIAAWCRARGHEVVDRPPALAADDVPLYPVLVDAAERLDWHEPVLLAQPTCPLLSASTIRGAMAAFEASRAESLIGVTAGAHLAWHRHHRLMPAVNRQTLARDGYATETGLRVYRHVAHWGHDPAPLLYPIPEREALDIDTPADLAAARALLARRRVHFRVNTGPGLGHLHRTVTLAEALDHHGLSFSFHRDGGPSFPPAWAASRLHPFTSSETDGDAELIVGDVLDTSESLVLRARADGKQWAGLESNQL